MQFGINQEYNLFAYVTIFTVTDFILPEVTLVKFAFKHFFIDYDQLDFQGLATHVVGLVEDFNDATLTFGLRDAIGSI